MLGLVSYVGEEGDEVDFIDEPESTVKITQPAETVNPKKRKEVEFTIPRLSKQPKIVDDELLREEEEAEKRREEQRRLQEKKNSGGLLAALPKPKSASTEQEEKNSNNKKESNVDKAQEEEQDEEEESKIEPQKESENKQEEKASETKETKIEPPATSPPPTVTGPFGPPKPDYLLQESEQQPTSDAFASGGSIHGYPYASAGYHGPNQQPTGNAYPYGHYPYGYYDPSTAEQTQPAFPLPSDVPQQLRRQFAELEQVGVVDVNAAKWIEEGRENLLKMKPVNRNSLRYLGTRADRQKHQLRYMAAKALADEELVEEMKAHALRTKAETRSKYGW